MTDGRTHWEGCWREHRDCAVAEVERLRKALDDLGAAIADAEYIWTPAMRTAYESAKEG
jgi:hypothetical protein